MCMCVCVCDVGISLDVFIKHRHHKKNCNATGDSVQHPSFNLRCLKFSFTKTAVMGHFNSVLVGPIFFYLERIGCRIIAPYKKWGVWGLNKLILRILPNIVDCDFCHTLSLSFSAISFSAYADHFGRPSTSFFTVLISLEGELVHWNTSGYKWCVIQFLSLFYWI